MEKYCPSQCSIISIHFSFIKAPTDFCIDAGTEENLTKTVQSFLVEI